MPPGVVVPYIAKLVSRLPHEGVRQGGWQHRRFWTEADDEKLRAGVKKYGAGRWAVILRNTDFNQNWTNINLKDRWRILEKSRSGSSGAPPRVREHSSVVSAARLADSTPMEQRIREAVALLQREGYSLVPPEPNQLALPAPRPQGGAAAPAIVTSATKTVAEYTGSAEARPAPPRAIATAPQVTKRWEDWRWYECGHCEYRPSGYSGYYPGGQRPPRPSGACAKCHRFDWQRKKMRHGPKKPTHTPIPMPRLPPLEVD